jgi:hypothetical protein
MGYASISDSSQLLGLSNGQPAGMFSSNLVGGRHRRFSRGKFKKIYKSYTKRGSSRRARSIKKRAKSMNTGALTKMMNKIKSLRKSLSGKTRRRKYRGGMNSTMSGNPLASTSLDTFGKPTSCLSVV